MRNYRLSLETEKDLSNIFEYGILKFGLKIGKEYLLGFDLTFTILANQSSLGKDASILYPNLKRFVYKSHTVFYLAKEFGILTQNSQ